jgi:prophage tail gpP-like protein
MAEAPRPESVSVLIDGERVEHWSEIEIVDSLDEFSTVKLVAPFEAESSELRELFRPFTFKPLKVFVGEDVQFTGTLVGVDPRITPEERSVEVTAIALPGVLVDCNSPATAVPLEFKKVDLRTIALALLAPFDLTVEFPHDPGPVFEKVKVEIDQKLMAFLVELAKQRNQVISNTAEGAFLCWRSVEEGNPVARLQQGIPPVRAVSASFNPQEYFSEMTGFASAKRGRKGSKHTELNPWLREVLRPSSFKLNDTEKGDAPEETRSRMARMFGNMAAYTVEDLPTWRDSQGDLWRRNTTVTLLSPDTMVYRETELLVRQVTLKQTAERYSATLGLVLPGAFSAKLPTQLPWME